MVAYTRYKRRLYTPAESEPFPLSRSKIDFFNECPRCFYLDLRLGTKRPSMPGFTLNIAVDHLLKKEFDIYRNNKHVPPLLVKENIEAIPFQHRDLETWRHNFTGIRYLHQKTNLEIFGAIDDVWENTKGELHIVDYKATSKQDTPTLEGRWGEQYKRQMEVYQWLFHQNDFPVSSRGFFVYVNGRKDSRQFNETLNFTTHLIPHDGDQSWIEPILTEIKSCLDSEVIPPKGELCEYCPYRESAGKKLLHVVQTKKEQEKAARITIQKENQSTKSLF